MKRPISKRSEFYLPLMWNPKTYTVSLSAVCADLAVSRLGLWEGWEDAGSPLVVGDNWGGLDADKVELCSLACLRFELDADDEIAGVCILGGRGGGDAGLTFSPRPGLVISGGGGPATECTPGW